MLYISQHSVTSLWNCMGWAAVVPKCFHFGIPLTVLTLLWNILKGRNFTNRLAATMHPITVPLEFSELFRPSHSFINACKGGQHGWVLDFIHLWQRDLNSKIKNSKIVHIVYFCLTEAAVHKKKIMKVACVYIIRGFLWYYFLWLHVTKQGLNKAQ